ncbi:MAG: DUF2062 domain-containing protein [Pyrinomonadaceae bacterium]|jgi:uncharacterized protein (DUF2062 family)|nr:DUF2062 domain-containing protein [Pyrinomonadaceae bacterium]
MFPATLRRLLAIDDPPERTALAFSIGVFIAFSPFLGLHTIAATLVAFLFRFNKIAIYAGTFLNNPFLTMVPIIVVSYALGAFVLGRPVSIPAEGVELIKNPRLFSSNYYHQVVVHSWYVVEPFALGASMLSIICSLLAYPLTLWLLRQHRKRRQESP